MEEENIFNYEALEQLRQSMTETSIVEREKTGTYHPKNKTEDDQYGRQNQ